MRSALLCAWLLVPAAAAAYHYGPGQERLTLDAADAQLKLARDALSAENWPQAITAYDAALAVLPAGRVDTIRRVRLERAKLQMRASMLPESYNDLTALIDELSADAKAPESLASDARNSLASAQYYLTWLMRLEGQGRELWEQEIEASRQNYRLLAEQAEKHGDEAATRTQRENLESAIRLARMDLSDLQALPIPSQCKGCCSGKCNGKGRSPQPKEGRSDARGASSGPPPDGRGS